MGDFAVPCFSFASALKKSPVIIAQELQGALGNMEHFERITVQGPYLNFFVDKAQLKETVIKEILKKKQAYGSSGQGKKKKGRDWDEGSEM